MSVPVAPCQVPQPGADWSLQPPAQCAPGAGGRGGGLGPGAGGSRAGPAQSPPALPLHWHCGGGG